MENQSSHEVSGTKIQRERHRLYNELLPRNIGGKFDEFKRDIVATLASKPLGYTDISELVMHLCTDSGWDLKWAAIGIGVKDLRVFLEHTLADVVEVQLSSSEMTAGQIVYLPRDDTSFKHIRSAQQICHSISHRESQRREQEKIARALHPRNSNAIMQGRMRLLDVVHELNNGHYSATVNWQKVQAKYEEKFRVPLNSAEMKRFFQRDKVRKILSALLFDFFEEVYDDRSGVILIKMKGPYEELKQKFIVEPLRVARLNSNVSRAQHSSPQYRTEPGFSHSRSMQPANDPFSISRGFGSLQNQNLPDDINIRTTAHPRNRNNAQSAKTDQSVGRGSTSRRRFATVSEYDDEPIIMDDERLPSFDAQSTVGRLSSITDSGTISDRTLSFDSRPSVSVQKPSQSRSAFNVCDERAPRSDRAVSFAVKKLPLQHSNAFTNNKNVVSRSENAPKPNGRQQSDVRHHLPLNMSPHSGGCGEGMRVNDSSSRNPKTTHTSRLDDGTYTDSEVSADEDQHSQTDHKLVSPLPSTGNFSALRQYQQRQHSSTSLFSTASKSLRRFIRAPIVHPKASDKGIDDDASATGLRPNTNDAQLIVCFCPACKNRFKPLGGVRFCLGCGYDVVGYAEWLARDSKS